MLQRLSHGFSKQELQHREKAERRADNGDVRQTRRVAYEHLLFPSLLLRSSSSQRLKSKSESTRDNADSEGEPGGQRHGHGDRLKERASTSRLAATSSPSVPLRTPSKSYSRAQETVRDGVYVSEKEGTAPEGNNTWRLRRQAESVSSKAKHKEPSALSVAALAGSSEASLGLAKQDSKPSLSPKRRKLKTPDAPARDEIEDEPKRETSKRGHSTSREVPLRRFKAPRVPHHSSIVLPPVTTERPTMAEAPARADPAPPKSKASEQMQPSSGVQSLSIPAKSILTKPPTEAESWPKQPPAVTPPPAKAGASVLESLRAIPEISVEGNASTQPSQTISADRPDQSKPSIGKTSPATSQSLVTPSPRSQSAPPGGTISAEQVRRPGRPQEATSTSDAVVIPKPRAHSAPPETTTSVKPPRDVVAIESPALKKVRKHVSFGDTTTYIFPVDPAHDLRSARRGGRRGYRRRSGGPYPRPSTESKKPAIWTGKEWRNGKKLRSHLDRRAAVARYWARTEAEEAAERQKACVREAEEEMSVEGMAPKADEKIEVEAKQTSRDRSAADDKNVRLTGMAVPKRPLAVAVPGGGDAKNATDAASHRDVALRALDSLSITRQESARDSKMQRRRIRRSALSSTKPVFTGRERGDNDRNRKSK
jgi:hypothetical protein